MRRGLSRSQARGHPRPTEPHAADVGRRRGRRAPRPRPRPLAPPDGARQALVEGRATDADLRALQRWRETPWGRYIDSLGGPLGLSLDVVVTIGSLGLQPTSIVRVEVTNHPTSPNLWRARFFTRQGTFRDRDLPRDPSLIGDLRLAFTGPDQDVELFVDTDGTTAPRRGGSAPPLGDEDAEQAWEDSYRDDEEREALQGTLGSVGVNARLQRTLERQRQRIAEQDRRIAELERAIEEVRRGTR